MKLLISILLVIPCCAWSQLTIEHLYETTKTYNPWFGKEKGALALSLELTYLEGGDSTLSLVMNINQSKLQLQGVNSSVGIASGGYSILGSIAVGMSASKSYALSNAQGIAVFDYKTYDSLLTIVNKLQSFSKKGIMYGKSYLYKVNKILIGLDMKISRSSDGNMYNQNTYYFQIDDSSFRLSDSEFTDLVDKTLEPLKLSFTEFAQHRLIVTPLDKP